MISEIDDCADKGNLIKRQELLKKVSVVSREIKALETPISETDVEEQTNKRDWVDIENERHNLEEKTTKELTEAPTLQTSEDKDSKRGFILHEINTKKRPINGTKAMSGAPCSEEGISREKANYAIQLFNKDISNIEEELRKLEPEQKNNNNWSLGDIIFFFIVLIIFIAVILYFLDKR